MENMPGHNLASSNAEQFQTLHQNSHKRHGVFAPTYRDTQVVRAFASSSSAVGWLAATTRIRRSGAMGRIIDERAEVGRGGLARPFSSVSIY